MLHLKTLEDLKEIAGKRVLVRADLNVPVDGEKITDDTRIVRFAPTAKFLSDMKAKVIIITHFGRPKGKMSEFSNKILLDTLSKYVGRAVHFVADSKGDIVKSAIADMKDGDILLLENIRFYKEEEENNDEFSKELSELGDVYVNDAFSTAHRAHASTEGITKYLDAYAGLLMEEEVSALSKALEAPAHPSVAIVGGSKVSTKLELLHNLTKKIDILVIGGAMANTFLLAKGYDVGGSLAESEMVSTAREILAEAPNNNCEIILPVDVIVGKELKEGTEIKEISIDDVSGEWKILDIGAKTIELIKHTLEGSKTVLWNGPVGAFEIKPFDNGSNEIARIISSLTKGGKIVSVAGGGDTVSAINHAGCEDGFTYISTAGGAFLEWLEGKTLPAIPPLMK